MDERYRDSLKRHYRLLMTHIFLSDDIIQQMAKEKILPDTMIKDIQEGNTRELRNERLLNALRLRGNNSYKHFRELMYRTGNFFVADLLWGEGDSTATVEEKELIKFPGLLNSVQENQKKKLIHYLDSKIREKALLLAWKSNPNERIEALHNKMLEVNQEKRLKDTIAEQERKINSLECSLRKEEEINCRYRMDCMALEQRVTAMKRDHHMSIDTQTRFHEANLSTIARLKERLSKCKASIVNLNDLVKKWIELGADDDEIDTEDDEVDLKISVLEHNVRKILLQQKLQKDQLGDAQTQREDLLKLLNRRFSKEPLVVVVKDVLLHEQKHRTQVMRDILRLTDILKQVTVPTATVHPITAVINPDPSLLDTKNFKTHLAMLKAEAEHIRKRFLWKDSEINSLRQEISALKQCLGGYACMTSPRAESPPLSTSLLSISTTNSPPNPPAKQVAMATASHKKFGMAGTSSDSHLIIPDRSPELSRVASTSKALHPAQIWKNSSFQDSKRSAGNKVVTFDEEGRRKFAMQKGCRADGFSRLDLDKTQVNAELYLQERKTTETDTKPHWTGQGDVHSKNAHL